MSSSPSRRVTIVTTFVAALLLVLPLMTTAETTGTIDNAPQQGIEETGDAPTPTSVPPTPTQAVVTPTATTAPSPTATATQGIQTPTPTTAPSPTPAATQATNTPRATATASPTATPPTNTDAVIPATKTAITLSPGEEREMSFSYQVTTPRTSTAIHAELRNADGTLATGWTLRGHTGDEDWSGDGASVDLTETDTTSPGSTFTITFTITAPTDVMEELAVSLFVSSIATVDAGTTEVGITEGTPAARIGVAPTSVSKLQSTNGENNIGMMAVAGEYNINVVDQDDNPLQYACYTVSFTTTLNLGVVGAVLNLLGLTATVTDLVNGLEGREPFDNCESGEVTPTGLISQLVTDLSALSLGGLLSLDGLLGAITVTPSVTATSHPAGYSSDPTISAPAFTLFQFKNSGAESTIAYEALSKCTPYVNVESITFDPSMWTGIQYPPTSGTLAIFINVSGDNCSGLPGGWSISAQPTDLTGPDTIDADDIAFTGTGNNQSVYLTPLPGFGLSGIELEVIATTRETTTFPNEGIAWQANFTLDPDDNLPPGDYYGQFTIDISNGP